MRDVYKDEEIGFAGRFEKEEKANGPTQREKDLARALDEMAKRAYKEQNKAKEAYKQGHEAAVVESAEVIRHLNSQITGLKGVITIKNKELDNSAIVVAQKDEIIARKDDIINSYEDRLNSYERIIARSDAALSGMKERLDKAIEIAEKSESGRLEAEELFYNEYEKGQVKDEIIKNQDEEIKDLRKRLHLVSVLANTDKDLPKGAK